MSNFNDTNDNIIDTDFIEVEIEEKLKEFNENKEPLYYTRSQVAKILGENESTISYWSKQFQSLLNIKIINMTRKYTKTNIENLMFIQKLLRKDKMTIKQVEQYCSEMGFNSEEGLVDTSNPLAIQSFVSAMTVEFDKKVTQMQNNILKQQQEMIYNLQNLIAENNKQIKDEISLTVDEVVTEKMNEFKEDFTKEITESNRIAQQSYDLMKKLEERKQESEKIENKSWFSRIFNKK